MALRLLGFSEDMSESEATPEELARDRTDLAFERTILSEERTFAAWIRTGLGAIASGFAVVKLAHETEPAWLASAAGLAASFAGIALLLVGYRGYAMSARKAESQKLHHVSRHFIALVTLTIACSALITVFLFLR